jgi:hypothetical protein
MKRVLLLASAAMFLAAAAVGAQNYVLTNGTANTFTATRNGVALAENVSQDSALNAIRRNSIGDAVTIQFGGASPLDMGSASLKFAYLTDEAARFNFTKIKLIGSIKSTDFYALSFTGSSSNGMTEVEISANIEGGGIEARSSASGYSFAITGGSINMTSGTSSMFLNNKVTISGGTFSKTSGSRYGSWGLFDFENTDLTITGGKFETKSNPYVISINGTGGNGKAVISGGEFKTDTAATSVIDIWQTVSVTISGGAKITNSASDGVAVNVRSATASLKLGGAPEITGALSFRYAGRVSADTSF